MGNQGAKPPGLTPAPWHSAGTMHFPPPRDEAAARRLAETFPEPSGPETAELLACLGGNSPYLADLAVHEPKTLCAILAQGPDSVCDLALSRLAAIRPTDDRARIAAALRQAKRQVALATAVADIGGAWSLEQVTGALSELAEGALRAATAHLLRTAHDRGELRLPHPSAPDKGSSFTVLAMGKLGARELNYSSDIDLILLYDAAAHPVTAETNGATFTRLARDLVGLMQQRDAGGYVFRTDLRLRPDPASTPPAVTLATALSYYESAAHTWERAAMIKARPVAGDLALGRRFLDSIKAFIWRRHLDFAAIADIRAMKQRVDEHKGTSLGAGAPIARLLGHDLKLGEGGIREIEFYAQTLQLVWGGRNPALRAPATLAALAAERQAGHLTEAREAELADAYRFLRRAEHRLQMVADRQTHALPSTPAGFADFAAFFGWGNPDAFAQELLGHLFRVRTAFSGLLEAPVTAPDLGATAIPPTPVPPEANSRQPGDAAPVWEAWLEGKPRALRTERARVLLRDILPAMRAVVARQPHPDTVWLRLDEFIHRLPAGVQFFSLIQHNPALLERLGAVLGAAPSLADHLAGIPAALEGFLAPLPVDPDPAASLAAQLQDAPALDQALSVASRFVRGEEFRLAVAELDGRIDQDQAGTARTALAAATIGALLPRVLAEQRRRYGRLRGGGLVVVAMGKAGSGEMMAGSDLDLMLIYDHRPDAPDSDGRTQLPASQYFARAAQALITALTVPTRDGKLYEVDMRLRPSGGKGPVAVSLASFERYHRESAWTWERLALTRARIVAGPPKLSARVAAAIARALRQGDPATILPDTLAMRARLLRDLPPKGAWDVKLRRGGLLELEFIAQSLQLLHGANRAIFDPCTRQALHNLASAGILPADEAASLIAADAAWRATQGLLRIALGRAIPTDLPAPLTERLSRAFDRILAPGALASPMSAADTAAGQVIENKNLVSRSPPLLNPTGLGSGTLIELPGRTAADRIEAVAAQVGASFARHVGKLDEVK
jgi:glutamate-ammonia-ligase adenylyltransferase